VQTSGYGPTQGRPKKPGSSHEDCSAGVQPAVARDCPELADGTSRYRHSAWRSGPRSPLLVIFVTPVPTGVTAKPASSRLAS